MLYIYLSLFACLPTKIFACNYLKINRLHFLTLFSRKKLLKYLRVSNLCRTFATSNNKNKLF